ncbi:hypothetical protein ElyMa_002071600, partial [Elysia marginata]
DEALQQRSRYNRGAVTTEEALQQRRHYNRRGIQRSCYNRGAVTTEEALQQKSFQFMSLTPGGAAHYCVILEMEHLTHPAAPSVQQLLVSKPSAHRDITTPEPNDSMSKS